MSSRGAFAQLNDGLCLSAADVIEAIEPALRGQFNQLDAHPVIRRRYTDAEKALAGLVRAAPRSACVVGGRYERRVRRFRSKAHGRLIEP